MGKKAKPTREKGLNPPKVSGSSTKRPREYKTDMAAFKRFCERHKKNCETCPNVQHFGVPNTNASVKAKKIPPPNESCYSLWEKRLIR